jgi:hypothetical protein
VCDPLASEANVYIGAQVVYAPLSTLHWNSEPLSLEANATLADETTMVAPDEIVVPVERRIVSGIIVSMTNVVAAGVESVLVAISIALTSNIWDPSVRPVYEIGVVQREYDPPSIRHS